MKILMVTNTYTPFVGGVPRSVETFAEQYRREGHRTIVIAPEFEDSPDDEEDVIRLPAIKDVSEAGFSVRLPIPGYLSTRLDEFEPDVVHAHHPFLLGDTALRVARRYKLPLVFTHHTLYEQYTHYLPMDNPAVKDYVVNLVSGYCNLCDEVFAPSGSVKEMLRNRGVETNVEVIPTGVDVKKFASGDGSAFRERHNIPGDGFLVGHVGRLAEEKNLSFLAESVGLFLREHPGAHFLLVGDGPVKSDVVQLFEEQGLTERCHAVGVLEGDALHDAYDSMDLFAFASTTETQGMVLVEAMSSGTPVVALDASGSRDVVDRETGRLVEGESETNFAEAMNWVHNLEESRRRRLHENVRQRAGTFSQEQTARRALDRYRVLIDEYEDVERDETLWSQAKRSLRTEWQILRNFASATDAVIVDEDD